MKSKEKKLIVLCFDNIFDSFESFEFIEQNTEEMKDNSFTIDDIDEENRLKSFYF